jgi:two-component system phosphate regulon response regulator PhoB
MNARILIVEDEEPLTMLLRYNLEAEGYEVETSARGDEADTRLKETTPDLIVLDWMLPGLSGIELCRRLRARPETRQLPIIMLTARGEETDKLVGLELGADDYMTKPFSPKELVARVRAVLRRSEAIAANAQAEIIRAADLTLDVPRLRLTVGERIAELTPTEFQLLATLASQPGRIFTRAQLLDAIHGVAFESYERAIDAHIKNIRRKIEPNPRQPRYILMVYGVGYKFTDQ